MIRTPAQGGYPGTTRSRLPPGGLPFLVPLPLDLSASRPPLFLPLVSCVFPVWRRTFIRNLPQNGRLFRAVSYLIAQGCLGKRRTGTRQINDHC